MGMAPSGEATLPFSFSLHFNRDQRARSKVFFPSRQGVYSFCHSVRLFVLPFILPSCLRDSSQESLSRGQSRQEAIFRGGSKISPYMSMEAKIRGLVYTI